MNVTKNVAKYLNEKGINLTVLAKKTGIPYPVIYSSLGLKSQANRELRADELISICLFLNLNPMDFADFNNTSLNEDSIA